jgi:transcriptional regulator with XRE-family HTH domain
MQFWDNVEVLRKNQNTSYRWLASKMGVSETTVSSMRHLGTEPRATEAYKIAEALHTSVEWLVTGKDSEGLIDEDRSLLAKWHELAAAAKETVMMLIDALLEKAKKSNERMSG